MKVSQKLEVRCWFKGDFLVSHYNHGAGFVARGLHLSQTPAALSTWIEQNGSR